MSTSISSVYVTGSQSFRLKACYKLNISENCEDIDLPELLFGRFNHSMTLFEHRFLFVYGGRIPEN